MSLYAPPTSFRSTSRAPHFGALRYLGADNKPRAWQEAFATFAGPFAYEAHHLNLTTDDAEGLAFVHSLDRLSATLSSGRITEVWLRWTACFCRIDGLWLVVHEPTPRSQQRRLRHDARAVVDLAP